jgi:hypothetical protein
MFGVQGGNVKLVVVVHLHNKSLRHCHHLIVTFSDAGEVPVRVVSTRSEVDIGDYSLLDLGGFLFKRFMVGALTRYGTGCGAEGCLVGWRLCNGWTRALISLLANDVYWIWSVKRGVHS